MVSRKTVPAVLALLALLGLVACAVGGPPRPKFPDRPPEDETLVAVPADTPTQPAAATSAPVLPTAAIPTLRILAVSAQPVQVAPGQETSMIINYMVGGIGAGANVQVEEHRVLLKEEAVISQWRDTFTRAAGTHTSRRRLRVSADAGRGIYTLKASVSAAGVRVESSGIFEVR